MCGRLAIAVLGCCAATLIAGPSDARARSLAASLRVSGYVTISFHGDRAAGCETDLRCDVEAGTITWTPQPSGDLLVDRIGGRWEALAFLFPSASSGVSAQAVVRRSGVDGPHVCADARSETFGTLPIESAGRRALAFALGGRSILFGAADGLLPSPTRCGGPLPADVRAALPRRTIAVSTLRRHATRIDLSGSGTFRARGLAGMVRSTMVLRLRKLHPQRDEGSDERPRRASRRRRPPLRDLSAEYRLVSLTGSVPVEFSGDPLACDPLDACGLGGTISITPGPARGEAYLDAYGRVPRAALRRALGLAPGPLPRHVEVYGVVEWAHGRGRVETRLDRAGVPACRDSSELRSGDLDLGFHGRRVTLRFDRASEGAVQTDPLRTRCPGPLLDALAEGRQLAAATIPRRAFGRRRLTIHLDRGLSSSTGGYRVRSRPDLTLVLRREHVGTPRRVVSVIARSGRAAPPPPRRARSAG
jgi:hypothetical protein